MSLRVYVLVNLVEKNVCGFGVVMATYLFRQYLLPPCGELSIKENISMNNARIRGGGGRRKDGGEEKIGAGCD